MTEPDDGLMMLNEGKIAFAHWDVYTWTLHKSASRHRHRHHHHYHQKLPCYVRVYLIGTLFAWHDKLSQVGNKLSISLLIFTCTYNWQHTNGNGSHVAKSINERQNKTKHNKTKNGIGKVDWATERTTQRLNQAWHVQHRQLSPTKLMN